MHLESPPGISLHIKAKISSDEVFDSIRRSRKGTTLWSHGECVILLFGVPVWKGGQWPLVHFQFASLANDVGMFLSSWANET